MKNNWKNKEMLSEYDFKNGVRGKYVKKYNEGTNIVIIEDDVRKIFPTAKSVNNALRALTNIFHASNLHIKNI